MSILSERFPHLATTRKEINSYIEDLIAGSLVSILNNSKGTNDFYVKALEYIHPNLNSERTIGILYNKQLWSRLGITLSII